MQYDSLLVTQRVDKLSTLGDTLNIGLLYQRLMYRLVLFINNNTYKLQINKSSKMTLLEIVLFS